MSAAAVPLALAAIILAGMGLATAREAVGKLSRLDVAAAGAGFGYALALLAAAVVTAAAGVLVEALS